MINLNPSLLPDDAAKRIREFLSHPGYQDLILYLANQAAQATAMAGNEAVILARDGGEYHETDGATHSKMAVKFLDTISVLQDMKTPVTGWQIATLLPHVVPTVPEEST